MCPGQASIDLNVLHGLQMQRDVVHLRDGGVQPSHNLGRRSLSAIRCSDVDIEPAAVDGRIFVADPNKADHGKDVRILGDDSGDPLLENRHVLERHVRRRVGSSGDQPGILRRHEAFRDVDVEPDAGKKRQHRKNERDRLMAQRPAQPPFVHPAHGIERALAHMEQAPALAGRLGLKQCRAHHRRQDQRQYAGNHDRDRERNCKLAKQAADESAHQQ